MKKEINFFRLALALTALTIYVYWPVGLHDFKILDTWHYYSKNPKILSGINSDNIVWAFTTFSMGNWHPLTWISYMLDAELFGAIPKGPHLVNLVIHAANANLLFVFLNQSTKNTWAAFFVSILFAIHPTQVESFAWIAERKDVLFCFFYFAGFIAHRNFSDNKTAFNYLIVVLIFALGLSSKAMMLTFPFALLLIDIWPLQRIRIEDPLFVRKAADLITDKLPLFILTAVFCYVTYKAQVDVGATNGGIGLTIYQRAQNALVAYSMYLQSALIPVNLSPFYPHPGIWAKNILLISCFISLSVGVLALLSIRKNPYIFVGVAMFFGTLVPTIGLVQVGIQAYADRYTYLPNIGLFIAIVYGGNALRTRFNVRPLFIFLPVFVLLISYASLTRLYLNQWQSNASLWSHSLMVLDPNYLDLINDLDPTYSTPQARALSFPYIMMGIALFTDGNVAFSVTHLEQARRLGMIIPSGWYWHGRALHAVGREADAFRSFDIYERSPGADKSLLDVIRQLRATEPVSE